MRNALFHSGLRRSLLITVVVCTGIVALGQAPATAPSPTPSSPDGTSASEPLPSPSRASAPTATRPTRDDGLLDPAWFSPDDLEFRRSGKLDYLWVRDGFTLQGRTLEFTPWTEPVLPATRDQKDRGVAAKLQEGFPPRLAEAFGERLAGKVKLVPADADLRVLGRIVDCNAGNAFGFVTPHFTFELKIVDRDGTLQVALHTRLVGRPMKMVMGSWADMVAKPFAEGIEGVWRGAKPSGP